MTGLGGLTSLSHTTHSRHTISQTTAHTRVRRRRKFGDGLRSTVCLVEDVCHVGWYSFCIICCSDSSIG